MDSLWDYDLVSPVHTFIHKNVLKFSYEIGSVGSIQNNELTKISYIKSLFTLYHCTLNIVQIIKFKSFKYGTM